MSHEHSETIQNTAGRWTNIFGRDTGNAGSRLPGMSDYATSGAADAAAAARSKSFHGGSEKPLDVQRYWERSYSPPVQEMQPMPGGLSSYRNLSPDPRDAMNPRNPSLASNTMSDQDNVRLDAMLQSIDSGASSPGTLGESRAAMPQPAGQDQNQWLQFLMQYLQQKQGPQGGPRPIAAPPRG